MEGGERGPSLVAIIVADYADRNWAPLNRFPNVATRPGSFSLRKVVDAANDIFEVCDDPTKARRTGGDPRLGGENEIEGDRNWNVDVRAALQQDATY